MVLKPSCLLAPALPAPGRAGRHTGLCPAAGKALEHTAHTCSELTRDEN